MEKSRFRSNRLVDPLNSALLVVDLQEKLLPVISSRKTLLFNADRLIRGARQLAVPVFGSTQYVKGLGPLDELIAGQIVAPEDKLDFSAVACESIMQQLREREIGQVVLAGIETHICITQTCLDLIAEHYDVFVVADAVASRSPTDHDVALARMQADGASVLTTESVLFEWCQSAANEQFKQISAIVREKP